jgi:hypothetical protein
LLGKYHDEAGATFPQMVFPSHLLVDMDITYEFRKKDGPFPGDPVLVGKLRGMCGGGPGYRAG